MAQGTWTGSYGVDGYLIANDAANPPAYATVSLTGDATTDTWAASTSDKRALQVSSGSTARSETISILDAASNAVLYTGTFSSFHNGEYAAWNIQGHVLIQVTRTGRANAVISGILFGPGSSVTFNGLDTTTQGTWTGKYGANGYLISKDATSPPAYATVGPTGDTLYTWAASTKATSALQVSSSSSTRMASCYYASTNFTINVNLTDGNAHQIAMYLLDWDGTSRSETVSILDAASNAVLYTGTFSSFHNGEYAVWKVQGHVLIRVTKTGGTNAVVSGIFFD